MSDSTRSSTVCSRRAPMLSSSLRQTGRALARMCEVRFGDGWVRACTWVGGWGWGRRVAGWSGVGGVEGDRALQSMQVRGRAEKGVCSARVLAGRPQTQRVPRGCCLLHGRGGRSGASCCRSVGRSGWPSTAPPTATGTAVGLLLEGTEGCCQFGCVGSSPLLDTPLAPSPPPPPPRCHTAQHADKHRSKPARRPRQSVSECTSTHTDSALPRTRQARVQRHTRRTHTRPTCWRPQPRGRRRAPPRP